jgi:hypothetical protein
MLNGQERERERERVLMAPAMTDTDPLAGFASGNISAFFRGNGTNVVKIAPETAIKLTCNDRIKHVICQDVDEITPMQRMTSGAISGAIAQVCAPFPIGWTLVSSSLFCGREYVDYMGEETVD